MKMKLSKISFFVVFSVTVASLSCYGKEKIVDKIIARVNNEVILLSEYNERADQVVTEYEKILTGPDKEEKIKELKKQLFEQMIDEKLLLQKAEKTGIKIADAEIDQGIDEIKARFEDEVTFQNEMTKQGFTGAAFRENVPA